MPFRSRIAAIIAFSFFTAPCAQAQVSISNGVPVSIPVAAIMDNNFAVNVTDIDFGNIVLTSAAGETGELAMATDGTFDESGNADPVARVLARNAAGQQGILAIGGGLPDTTVYVSYSNVQNLTCVAGCSGPNPDIVVAHIGDDMPDQAGAWSVDDASPDADAIAGQGVTDGMGAITVNIGATLRSANTASPYQPGAYEGSFDVMLAY